MSLDSVIDALNNHFGESKPSSEEVREQRAVVVRAHWLKQWGTIDLEIPPILRDGEARFQVTRQELLDAAKTVETEEDAVDLYVRVAGWGSGTSALSVGRTAQALRQPGTPRALLESARAAVAEDPVDVYRALKPGGEFRIKHFGPAFFTKWMYFNGFDQVGASGRKPLILDARVARTLGWRRTSGWASSTYSEFLDMAEELRREWAPDQEPHVIEYALFKAGNSKA